MDEELIVVGHGPNGRNGARPGLHEAMAAGRAGHALVVSKLDRLARSLPDARDIANETVVKGVSLRLTGTCFDTAALVAARSTLTGQHLAAYVGA